MVNFLGKIMKEEVEFRSLVPYVKENLIKHHELYSAQCKAEYWEENCSNALKKSGFGSDWKPDFKHTHGVDQTTCLLYTSPSPRDRQKSRMPSSA